jgi:hypothetical protein
MHLEGVDDEARREAHVLENIVHRHVCLRSCFPLKLFAPAYNQLTVALQVVQLVGTYVLHQRLYLSLYPIAECTLRE